MIWNHFGGLIDLIKVVPQTDPIDFWILVTVILQVSLVYFEYIIVLKERIHHFLGLVRILFKSANGEAIRQFHVFLVSSNNIILGILHPMSPYPPDSFWHMKSLRNWVLWIDVFTQIQIHNKIFAECSFLCWIEYKNLMVPRFKEIGKDKHVCSCIIDPQVRNIN